MLDLIADYLLDVEEILDQAIQQLAKVVEATASSIWLLNESSQRIAVASATGEKSEQVKAIQLNVGEGIAGWVVKEGKTFITQDARLESHHALDIAEKLNFEGVTMICVPMRARDRIVGAIQALNRIDDRLFNDKDRFCISVVANLTGIALENARLYRLEAQENSTLRRELGKRRLAFRDIIGDSSEMSEMLNRAAKVAETNSTVLIRGESGRCKESSQRLPEPSPAKRADLNSQMAVRFSLTRSGTCRSGCKRSCCASCKIEKFYRVGGTRPLQCDVRIIAATNQELEEQIKKSEFLEDLYYRLNVITIYLPSLRERVEDIPTLADYFLTKYSMETKRHKTGLSPQAYQLLKEHKWPGNVRELENSIEHAVVLGRTEEIQPNDLPISLRQIVEEIRNPANISLSVN